MISLPVAGAVGTAICPAGRRRRGVQASSPPWCCCTSSSAARRGQVALGAGHHTGGRATMKRRVGRTLAYIRCTRRRRDAATPRQTGRHSPPASTRAAAAAPGVGHKAGRGQSTPAPPVSPAAADAGTAPPAWARALSHVLPSGLASFACGTRLIARRSAEPESSSKAFERRFQSFDRLLCHCRFIMGLRQLSVRETTFCTVS